MEHYFVVGFSEEAGWFVDDEALVARFGTATVWDTEAQEWLSPPSDSDFAERDWNISVELGELLDKINSRRKD